MASNGDWDASHDSINQRLALNPTTNRTQDSGFNLTSPPAVPASIKSSHDFVDVTGSQDMVQCQNCGRNFFANSLAKHQKYCKAGKPLKPAIDNSKRTKL